MSETHLVDVEKEKCGIAVTALMREYLNKFVDYTTAVELSNEFDATIRNADWLETLNGTTFDKGFCPTYFKSKQNR